MNGCAITDHINICGSIAFLKVMTDAKKKPIIGVEFSICEHHSTIQNENNRRLTHLLLLSKNDNGWKNLIKLKIK